MKETKNMKEEVLKARNGMPVLLLTIFGWLFSIAVFVVGCVVTSATSLLGIPLIVVGVVWFCVGWIPFCGLKVLKPHEALVFTLFGKYIGTLKGEGFYYVNPFVSAVNPAAKTTLRQSGDVDTTGDGEPDEGSLRGSSEIVAARIRDEIQSRVKDAGLEILEARITYLAYAPEIAAVMLQRQQASAVVDARKMIVDGAVGMVDMALSKLNESGIVQLDEERKATMVSNLLVVLCGNKDAQPVVNSGSLY